MIYIIQWVLLLINIFRQNPEKKKRLNNFHDYPRLSAHLPSSKLITKSAERRDRIVNIKTIISSVVLKRKNEGGKKKQTNKTKKWSEQLSKTFERDSQPDQIQREQPGCRARTGQTTFSTLQGACNFYRRDASRRCFGGKLKLRLTLSSLETWLRRVARVAKLSHRSRERR